MQGLVDQAGLSFSGTDITCVAQDVLKLGDVVYTVTGDVLTAPILAPLSLEANVAVFSPDGKTLVLGGDFAGYAKIYTVSETELKFVRNIYADAGTTALTGNANSAAFSPSGNALVLGGQFSGFAKVYSVSGTAINFVSNIYADAGTTALTVNVGAAVFSPNGATLVLGGDFVGKAKVYTVSGTTITYAREIYADAGTTVLSSGAYAAVFSPSGDALFLGGFFSGFAKVYSVSGTTITFVSNIYADAGTTALSAGARAVAISPSGGALVVGGDFTGYAKIYSVSGTTVTYVRNLYADAATTALSAGVNGGAFSPSGTSLVVGGGFTGRAKVYSVSGTTINFVSNIYANAGTTALSTYGNMAAYAPSGNALILGGGFTGYAKVYAVLGTANTFVSNIFADAGAGAAALNSSVLTAAFSPLGGVLVLGGYVTGCAKVYSVSGTTITFISNIYANVGTTALNNYVSTAAFAPSGTALVLGGGFTGYAKVYSVSGTTITFVSNIYADAATTALSNVVNTASFSPNGTALVVGGTFSGYAKVYSVSGTTITYVRNLYADAATTALNLDPTAAAFSPSGNAFVLGGYFTGRAKVYSVSGTTINFVSNIYADAGTTALTAVVRTVAISPAGDALVLGGDFAGYAKVYSISGTTVTYIRNIYADAGTTLLSAGVKAAAFSQAGTSLVLGGSFTGCAKVYSVSGTTITFISNIYANVGTTALNNYVSTAAFFPSGTVLVLGGNFSGYAKVYSVSGTTVTYLSKAYKLRREILLYGWEMSVGYAKVDIAFGSTGAIRVFA